LPEADSDLDDHFAYLLGESPSAAFRFLESADKTFRLLSQQPSIGYLRRNAKPSLKDIRSFPVTGFPNWLVFYRPTTNEIEIVRILHGATNIPRILGEDL
ncbi:MAG: type II toxin-antitoxin system RelE/ParE family toxin, partial [Candidatus Omnitrophica bacterium]|nr:type II toxin-antitoxin system RelE/ParE family toxin [Candidatus Omnitrophota bacterium]